MANMDTVMRLEYKACAWLLCNDAKPGGVSPVADFVVNRELALLSRLCSDEEIGCLGDRIDVSEQFEVGEVVH